MILITKHPTSLCKSIQYMRKELLGSLTGKGFTHILNSKAYKLVYLYIINPDSVIWFTVEIAEFDQSVNELKY